MSKEGQKKKEEEKNCGFIKQKRNTLTGVYSPETFFLPFFFFDYKTVLFLASQGFARRPYQSHSAVL